MENKLMTIEGVRGYADEKGTVFLNVEDVARGLGFVQVKNGTEYVRYDRISGWLREYGFPHRVGKGDFISENMFYRLAMKANNEAAKAFQAKVADEILPSIRKTGVYMTLEAAEKILFNPDFIIGLAQQVKSLQTEVAELKPDAQYCRNVLKAPNTMSISVIAKEFGMSGQALNKILTEEKIQHKVGDTYVLNQPYAKMGYAEIETVPTPNGSRHQLRWYEKGRSLIHTMLAKKYPTNRERIEATPSLFGGETS